MNSKQRRTTFRHLRKLMAEQVPVVFRLSSAPGDSVQGRVIHASKQRGIAVVCDPQQHFKPQRFAAHRIKAVPRCYRWPV